MTKKFIYVGSIVDTTGFTDKDIEIRIEKKARNAYPFSGEF